MFDAVGYHPHDLQAAAHRCEMRVVQVVGGERAGKSRWTAMEAFSRMPWATRMAVVARKYEETRKETTYLIDALNQVGALAYASQPRHGAWLVRSKTGCEIINVSLDRGVNALTGTGEPFDVVMLVEAGLIPYDAFLAARGRTSETRGVVLMSGTLWDNWGWYADLYEAFNGPNAFDGQRFSFPSWSNAALFPQGKDDPEIAAWRDTLPADEAARRIDAKLVPSPARIYPEFNTIHHVSDDAAFDPDGDVLLFVDSGYYPSRYAVLAIQLRKDSYGREIVCVVDEIWEHNKVHEEIIEMCQDRPWATNVIQAIGGHETKQHNATESTAEVWMANWAGLYFETFDAGLILEGARVVKMLLKPPDGRGPRLYLSPKCTGTAKEFHAYKRKCDRAGNVVSQQPEDRNNDAMDALRDGVVWRYGLLGSTPPEGNKNTNWGNPYG